MKLGDRVRVFSSAGPCLRFYEFVKENKKTVTLRYKNGDNYSYRREVKSWVHTEPCSSCSDHPQTQYPNGYMN